MGLITRLFQQNGTNRISSNGSNFGDSGLAQFHATVSQGVAGGQFVVRMTNVLVLKGLSINTNLDTVTIQQSGLYALDFTVATNSATYAGITKNQARDGTGIAGVAISKVLVIGNTVASTIPTAFSVTAYLVAGDFVCGHIHTGTTANDTYSQFRITQLLRS